MSIANDLKGPFIIPRLELPLTPSFRKRGGFHSCESRKLHRFLRIKLGGITLRGVVKMNPHSQLQP